jgi:hypothetical protein
MVDSLEINHLEVLYFFCPVGKPVAVGTGVTPIHRTYRFGPMKIEFS